MKSVVAQSSTLAKAVEEAWNKAGRPEEFFIKILEEPTNGFLGFRAKKAKVGLFFKPSEKKEEALVPQVLQQKEYTSYFNNANVTVESEGVEQKAVPVAPKVQPRRQQQPRAEVPHQEKQQLRPRTQQPRQPRPQVQQSAQTQSANAQPQESKPMQQRQLQQRPLQQRPLHKKPETVAQEPIIAQEKSGAVEQNSENPRPPRKRYYRRNNHRRKSGDEQGQTPSFDGNNSNQD